MNAFRLLRCIEDYLRPLMGDDGVLTIGAEPEEGVAALESRAPDKWGVALVWQGYAGPEDGDAEDWQGNRFSAFVRVPVGMPAVPGDALHRAIGEAGVSVLERIEWVSVALRRMKFTNADIEPRRPRLVRSGWWRKEDRQPIRVHELEFELVTCLDQAAQLEELTVAE